MTFARRIEKDIMRHPWPHIYKVTHRSGHQSWIVDIGIRDGKRKRYSKRTRTDAELLAENLRVARNRSGELGLTLSPEILSEVAECNRRLRKRGLTIKQATDFAIAHLASDAPPVAQIVELLIESARSTGRRSRTVTELRLMLRRFAATFGERKLGTIRIDELSGWVDGLGVGDRTRLHNIVKVGQLYNFAIRRGWVDVNLSKRLDRPRVAETEPGVFTVEQAAALLKHSERFGLLGYVAIGLFAGLRPEELRRLPADAVKVSEHVIVVGAGVAKKPSRGSVPINETLAAWLPRCWIGAEGLAIPPRNFRRRFAALRAAAKIEPWPHDGLRHSFGSYDFAMHGDADATANKMRHADKRVFHAHYKALVSKADAERYWALRP